MNMHERRSQGHSLLYLLAVLALLQGCAGDHSPLTGRIAPRPDVALGQAEYSDVEPSEYRLHPHDAIEVRVYGEPELSSPKILIGQDGGISMPLVGKILASGLTTDELSKNISGLLLRELRNPQVAVNLIEYGSQRVTVEGSVSRPGVFQMMPGATLSSALALAGGPDRFARVRQIAVFRKDREGRSVAVFDLRAVRAGTMIDPVLQRNDRVVVGVSGMSRFYQDILSAVPAFALFTRF